ncbi:MAG TPA: CsbD family protein [Casimicrobiaceae bacterium]|nr:CsbD family protein [Casimicrobiaceae bacterium]
MNRDQVQGTVKDVAGKVQQKVGEATGSVDQQVKGVGKQVEGKVQKGVGDVEQAADRAKDADTRGQ